MIEVSVAAGDVVAGRRSPLTIRFANNGPAPCSNIVFALGLPAGIVLMGGSGRVEIPMIPAGRTYLHEIAVEARRPGRYELTSMNFSYRDERDVRVRVTDFRAGLVVAAPPPPTPGRHPTGRLGVGCESGELDLGAWDVLRIVVTNDTGVALDDVTVAVEGPFADKGGRSRVAALGEGAKARFRFHVNAAEGGRHVPVIVRTTYSYRDGTGTVRTLTQVDGVSVVVRPALPPQEAPLSSRAAPLSSRVAPAGQTILYLAASPRNLPPLRSDLEMRKVKERLQLSRYRDRYRIEPYLAVRFDDISQALVDYEPQVVHFSGHGARNGDLCVEDERGDSEAITPEGLAGLFGLHRSTIRCVVVNACYSVRLAEALAAQIDHVIGMRYRIGDEAAIQFSVGFYLALFAGWSVPDAFARGQKSIQARSRTEPDHLTPLIFPAGPGVH